MTPQQQAQFMNHDERGPRTSREARQAARAAKNGNSHYRRAHSPDLDDFAFSGGDEPRSPTSDVALHDAILAQAQHQQRVVPVGQQLSRNQVQRKPPGGGNPPINGQGPPKSQPPSYSGPEDALNQNGQPRQGHYRRNTGEPVRRPSASNGPTPPGPEHSDSHMSPPRSAPNGRRGQLMSEAQQRGPHSPGGLSAEGNSINRLNSPSVMKSVLQPLELKINEYDILMQEAQQQMQQLDEELRLMQDRRMQAEERYLEAKSKHDEYERQHEGVGRALRGEPERRLSPDPMPLPRVERIDSYDDRPVSNQSSQKMKGRSRLRLSLFKN